MEQEILIPSSHVKYLVPAYRQRINEIDILIKELTLERNQLASVISKYSSDGVSPANKAQHTNIPFSDGYDATWTWFAKTEFILKAANEPMSTAQIVDQILKYEPELDRRKTLSSMSATLAVKAKSNSIVKHPHLGADYTYELPK